MKNKKLYVVTFIRLIVIPLAVLMLFRLALIWMPMENAEKLMLIPFLATITPAAFTVMQLAQIHNEDAELAVAVNVATSILSIVTMPAFVWLYFL